MRLFGMLRSGLLMSSGTGDGAGGGGGKAAGDDKGGADKGAADKAAADKAAADKAAGGKSLLDLADDDAAAGDKGGGDKGAAGKEGGAKLHRPDGLADDMLGATDQETIDKLFARTKGLRDQLAKKGGTAVEKPDDYKLELGDELGKIVDVNSAGNKPVFDVLRAVAQKHALTQEAFGGFIKDATAELQKAGLFKPAADPVQISGAKEFGNMVKLAGGEKEARALLKDEKAWVSNLVTGGVLTAEEGAVVSVDYMGTAKGWEVLRKLRAHWTGKELPPHQVDPEVTVDALAIEQRYKDPKFKTDAAFRAETERLLRANKKAAKHGKD